MEVEKKYRNSYKLESNIDPMDKKPNRFGVRHIQCIYICFGMIFGYFLRVNISAAVVYMIKTPEEQKASEDDIPYYDWDSDTKNLLLSGFFWGYVVAQVPSGLLAKRFGGKITLAISTLICGIVTLLHPIAARLGDWQLFLACRIVVGLTQGTVYPCVHTLLAKWTPKTERSFLGSFVYSGAQIGTVIILGTSGAFSETPVGWPSIFFFSGACAVAWSLLYMFFGLDGPEESKSISIAEREYILHHTGSGNTTVQKNLPVPWGALFTSLPFYSLILAHCGFTWGFYTLLTEIPSYLDKGLGLQVNKNALLSALPYFVMWVLSYVMSPISDYLINSGKLSVANTRKFMNSLGQWVPMVCLITCGYMSADQSAGAIACLTIAVGFNSASYSGYMMNHMDLSPNFAGTMMGITNGISNLLSIFAPLLVSAVVKDETRQDQWRIVFFITAGVYLVCNTCFVIFGQGTVQSWNEPKNRPSIANLADNDTNNNSNGKDGS